MKSIHDLSIQTKIMVIPIISGLIMTLWVLLYLLPLFQSHIITEKETATRHIVELATGILADYENQAKTGAMTEDEAKTQAVNRLSTLRYDGKEYIWINDLQPKMIMHPYSPELVGKDLGDRKDEQGKPIFLEMVRISKEKGGGLVRYLWPKPGETKASPKISYVKLFEPWSMIVGSGIYVDDAIKQVNMIRWILLAGNFAFVLFTIFLTFFATRILATQPINQAIKAADALAGGDFKTPIISHTNDEAGKLLHSMNIISEKITPILRSIHSSSKQMGQSSLQIAEIADEISSSSQAQQEQAFQVTTATGELRMISESVRDLAESVRTCSLETEREADQGLRAVTENIDQIKLTVDEVSKAALETEGLQEVGNKIHQIIESITDIADQTNLLALNAAIEAARAGDQGRGFAVVADEVRNLASRTTRETEQITKIIAEFTNQVTRTISTMKNVVERVHGGSEKTHETADVIERMVYSVRESATANMRISEVSQSQMQRLEQLQVSLDSLFETIKESGSKVGVTAAISTDLNQVTKEIIQLMSNFTFDTTNFVQSTDHENRKDPRAQNGLLTIVIECDGSKINVEGITSDFSMSGLQLRLPATAELKKNSQLTLEIMTPHDSLNAYQKQQPLRLDSKIVWIKGQGLNALYGLEFLHLNNQQTKRLEECFGYFSKNARY